MKLTHNKTRTMTPSGEEDVVTVIHVSQHDSRMSETDSSSTNMSSRYILRPVLLCLTLTAQFGYISPNRKGEGQAKVKSSFIHRISLVYRVVVFVLLVATFCRNIPAILVADSKFTTFTVMTTSWLLQCVGNTVLNFKTFHRKYGNLRRFLDFWDDKIVPELAGASINLPVTNLRRKQMIGIGILAAMCVMNTIFTALLASGIFSLEMKTYYAAPFASSPAVLACHVISYFFLTMAWTSPMLFIVSVSLLLKNVFTAFESTLENEVVKNGDKIATGLRKFRRVHHLLCKTVADLDKDISYFFASSFVFGIFQSSFCLYHVLNTDFGPVSMVMAVFWVVAITIAVVVVAGFAASVNEAAHSPLDSIFGIDVDDMNSKQHAELNLFLSKLTGTQIGFTAFGLVTITKEFLLTVCGAFLTYFLLLCTL